MAITVKELIEQLSKYRPEAEVGMHSSLEGVVRGQAESMVVLYVESDFDNEDDDEEDDEGGEDEDDLEDDICPRCEEEEVDCIC